MVPAVSCAAWWDQGWGYAACGAVLVGLTVNAAEGAFDCVLGDV